ncbi:acyl-CoA dehydrogenase family protein [Bailinhaonella thermotolerans]|uniref:Acyl-CoA dehydrogenase n=1 Tax=Bailinhaonella thermotolerans TaxID=1070861 RepID=A0A3A4B2G9_9ACTN|nr:acyl-CoA dehydrogenase family protein [Bailinhaonella thermotolerans]RJL35925.1 acyl-CoA dehydrogenase [Bailinhaonella thermotolerans]
MRSLAIATRTCDRLLPGLHAALSAVPLLDLEKRGNPGVELFRAHGGPGLLIPAEYGGAGASALDAVRVVAAIASRAPSLAVGTAMHHFSVATLFMVVEAQGPEALETVLLREIAGKGLLVSSAGAEGRSRQSIVAPAMTARPAEGGYVVDGSKKPCSLARSMDLLTATVALPDGALGLMFAPADLPGISVHPFWASDILAGAESEEVRFTGVRVPEEFIVRPDLSDPSGVDAMQAAGFIWFECVISAVYLGIASALVERAVGAERGSVAERAALGVRLESAGCLVEGLARMIDQRDLDNDALARSVITRLAVQDAVGESARRAVELLGGMAFVTSPEIGYLLAASQLLAFHPPARTAIAPNLADYFAGRPFRFA